MDISMIPASLGVLLPERVQKWLAYRKSGTLIVDTTLEGRNDNGNAPLNTIFNGYDDSLQGQAVQAIQIAIDSVEATVSSITGVFRERLNGIELRDAVTNIKLGALNSFIVTKHYYLQMDLVVSEILLDSLNLARSVFKKGLTGTIILGDNQLKIFTALPEHFTMTDFDVHITSSTLIMEDMMNLKNLIPEFIKSGSLAPDIIFDAINCKSLSDLKYKVLKAMQILKEENNQIKQLLLKLLEAEQQILQMQKLLKEAELQVKQLDQSKLELEKLKIEMEYKVDWFKALTDRKYKDGELDLKEKQLQREIMQLHDGNPYNDIIRDV